MSQAFNLLLKDAEKESPLIWSVNNIKLPKDEKWSFVGREWQADIFDDQGKEVVVIKPTQIGMSTISLCKTLHFAAVRASRSMYTLPRQDDVTDFVRTKVDPVMESSPNLRLLGGAKIDNVRLKVIGDSYIHFMESSVTPRMLDVDYMINDEVDMSDQDNLEQYIARMDASRYGYHHRLSTPTIYDYGIDSYYKMSDMKVWMVTCPRCNRQFELEWETHVRNRGGKTWYACESCSREITPEIISSGMWVATSTRPNPRYSGYAISYMNVPYKTPQWLWDESERMKPKNFANLRLGRPFAATTASISRKDIMTHCFDSGHSHKSGGRGYFVGADQGNEIHVVVGRKTERGVEIVHMEVIPLESGFDRLEEIVHKYGARKAVVDANPNRHPVHKMSERFPGRVFAASYSYAVDAMYKQSPNEPKVTIHRTDVFDALRDMIINGGLQFYGSKENRDNIVNRAVQHLSAMRRDEFVQRTPMGGEKLVAMWRNTDEDHFAHALAYLITAADMGSAGGLKFAVVGDGSRTRGNGEEETTSSNPYARSGMSSRYKTLMERRGRTDVDEVFD